MVERERRYVRMDARAASANSVPLALWPLGGDQAGTQGELEVELEPVRKATESLDAPPQMGDRLDISKAPGGDFAGAQPITRCLFGQPRLSEIMCQGFRFSLDEVHEGPLDGPRNGGVQVDATALEQTGIGGIADKGQPMFKSQPRQFIGVDAPNHVLAH